MATALQRQFSVEERYGFIKQIGKGSYADAWIVVPIATIAKGTRYVLKRINLRSIPEETRKAAEREVEVLSALKHPNIVRYVESFHSYDLHFNIVMHYCEGGDLYTKIRDKESEGQMFEEAKVIEWCIEICMALEYIHKRHILHRDLKTRNIFLTKQEMIKVGDFGISRVLEGVHDLATTIVGTPYYMSPEVLSSKPYNQKSDIWSLGCCMYELVNLDFAFKASNMNALVLTVIQSDTPKISGNYSDELKKLIKTMLSKQPDDRPSATEILEHKYIKHHLLRMLEDTKRRVDNTTERKKRRKRDLSSLSSETELTTVSPSTSFHTMSLTESYSGDTRTQRRQKVPTQQLSMATTMVEPKTTCTSNTNCLVSSTDKLNVWERCPIEILMYYFEQHEIQDEENCHHAHIQNEFTSLSNSSPGAININKQQERSNTTGSRPTAEDPTSLFKENSHRTNSRFSDIGNLPDQILLPIEGYNNEPLTSLENAIQSVRHFLGSIDTAIIVAKQNAQKRHGKLSVDESAAIQLYTMEMLPLERCLYFVLNKTLRSERRRDLIPWFPYLKLLMTALWKLPSVVGTVWRGIKGIDLSAQYQEGQRYTWWNLSSCTETLNVMQKSQFLGTDGLRTLFSIDCKNGKEIKEHSYVQAENEILLPPATYFEVIGKVNPAADLHIIHVRQITPPYELICPPF